MRTLDFENHFITQGWVDALLANDGHPRLTHDESDGKWRLYYQADAFEPFGVMDRLLDLGDGRIAAMDAAGVDLAVLSLTAPGCEQLGPDIGPKVAREANDAVAAAVAAHPDRFLGYAALYPKDVDDAVQELERAVRELGLRGWKTHSNFGDSFLDEKRYWPILAKAEELGVPVYLHPAAPMIPELRTYGLALAGAAFGFGVETATAMVRLILSGALDAFPRLQIILGHYGEGLPFIMQRIDHPFVRPYIKADGAAVPSLKHPPSYYLRTNMWVSTSGNYLKAAFDCTREALGLDRIVLGTDHPYEDMNECMDFLGGLGLSDSDITTAVPGQWSRTRRHPVNLAHGLDSACARDTMPVWWKDCSASWDSAVCARSTPEPVGEQGTHGGVTRWVCEHDGSRQADRGELLSGREDGFSRAAVQVRFHRRSSPQPS